MEGAERVGLGGAKATWDQDPYGEWLWLFVDFFFAFFAFLEFLFCTF